MNPRLVKFTVELQTGEKTDKKNDTISFKDGGHRFFNLFKQTAKVTIPIDKNY